MHSLTPANIANQPTDRGSQNDDVPVTGQNSEPEGSQLSTYMARHRESSTLAYDRVQSARVTDDGDVAGPSSVNQGRLSPVSIDVTESTSELRFS